MLQEAVEPALQEAVEPTLKSFLDWYKNIMLRECHKLYDSYKADQALLDRITELSHSVSTLCKQLGINPGDERLKRAEIVDGDNLSVWWSLKNNNAQLEECRAKHINFKSEINGRKDCIAKLVVPGKQLDNNDYMVADILVKDVKFGQTAPVVDIYFGGSMPPGIYRKGDGHGHAVVRLDTGDISYLRLEYELHGSKNYGQNLLTICINQTAIAISEIVDNEKARLDGQVPISHSRANRILGFVPDIIKLAIRQLVCSGKIPAQTPAA